MRGAVPDLPKPLAPVLGRPFLEFLLEAWIRTGIERFVLSVGYRAEAIVSHFGSSFGGARIDYAIEDAPLGTGGALRNSCQAVPDATPFLVLNGDTFFEAPPVRLIETHQATGAWATLALAPHPGTSRFDAVALDPAGKITALKDRDSEGAWINGGVYFFSDRWPLRQLPNGPLSFEREVLPAWIDPGLHVAGCPCPGRFIDIGIPDDYRAAESFFALHPHPERDHP